MSGSTRAEALLGTESLVLWQRLGTMVRRLLAPAAFPRALAPVVGTWAPEERIAWLEAALALAARSPRAAIALYRDAPAAVSVLSRPLRGRLLALVHSAAAAADVDEMERLVPVLGVLVLEVPRPAQGRAMEALEAVAAACPAAFPGFLRSIARVMEESGDETRLDAWLRHGLGLAAGNGDAGRAYFALQSRTSLRVLHASPTAVPLEEIESVLHRYIQMLSGEPATVHATVPFRVRQPLEEHGATGGVALPATIDLLGAWEDNARLYRVMAALLAARREFGTYADDGVLARVRGGGARSALEECFLLADGFRVAHRLLAIYPGLRHDLAWAAASLLGRWRDARPGAMHFLDALLLYAIAPAAHPPPPWLHAAAALAIPMLRPLGRPTATASDAATVAELLAALLSIPTSSESLEPPLPLSAEYFLAGDDEGPFIGNDTTTPDARETIRQPGDLPREVMEDLELRLGELAERMTTTGRSLSAEELKQLIEAGLTPEFGQGNEALTPEAGLYITQLLGKLLARRQARPPAAGRPGRPRALELTPERGAVFVYDEWDHVIADYRRNWCTLGEVHLGDDGGLFFTRTLERYAPLVPEIRRHFQRVRPESWRTLRGLEDGEDFDLNAVIDARAEQRARRSPSPKLYTTRARLEREVATLFLLDMSASTDEAAAGGEKRRIIEIEKEALVIMAAALDEIGDAFAIYGFSGQGRQNVEFYPIKDFGERLAAGAKGRIGAIQPRCSTRMGTALRHAVRKMRDVRAPNRHLILISDGFPQDLDYGEDRRSHAYGISDTAVALREVSAAHINPFCITVDLAGHDYLRDMCDPQRYMIIENVEDLPRELPKIYQRLVQAA